MPTQERDIEFVMTPESIKEMAEDLIDSAKNREARVANTSVNPSHTVGTITIEETV
jgi:hypothetical protein